MTRPRSTPTVSDPVVVMGRVARANRTHELFRLAATTTDATEAARALDEVVVLNISVAESLVSRYRRRGIDEDDIAAVARLALVKAAQRFDITAGHEFLSFAAPTIRGEVRRYFRDNGWMVRPPRRIQELQAAIATVEAELSTRLGRSPRPTQIAEALDVELSDVQEALAARGCFSPASLDLPVTPEAGATVGDLVANDDHPFAATEARVALKPLVQQLSERDRRVLELRFFHELSQNEIASHIGVTQMQVSRLIARILKDLRRGMTEGPEALSQKQTSPASTG